MNRIKKITNKMARVWT